jgi:hypothetical protein
MKRTLTAITLATLFVATTTNAKPTLERGWIGGEYEKACRKLVPDHARTAVYVKQIYPDTPAAQAGLQPADLILAIDGREVADLKSFRRLLDAAKPGSRAPFKILRAGQTLDLPVTIGRETYQEWHSVLMGFAGSTKLDLLPNPDFSILHLLRFERPQERIELRSPEKVLAKQATRHEDEPGVRSKEGWDAWFLIFGANAHKRILSQEAVSPSQAKALPVRAIPAF